MSHTASAIDLDWARRQDACDTLAPMRSRFAIPKDAHGEPLVYLCGHSLGLAPIEARQCVDEQLRGWEQQGVRGHEQAPHAWIGFAERLRPALARLAGAAVDEVIAMNSLSVNLHLLLASFYQPTPQRRAILIEAGAFSSDRYAVASQIAWHGHDPATDLIELAPRNGENCLRIEDIEHCLASRGEHIALVLWPAVQYLTGQAFDVRRIVRAAHAAGCLVGLDLAHAIGNVRLTLHDDDADFAVWCSYKYLNGGPGAIGGAFVHQRHSPFDTPRLNGWWGHALQGRFAMQPTFAAASGAAAWAVSNPPVLSAAPLLASLPLFEQAGAALHAKSQALTGYALQLLLQRCGDELSILTPTDPAQRGAQLSIRIRGGADRGQRVFEHLIRRGVICDWRQPDIIRLAPVPLYNRYEDVWHGVDALTTAVRGD